MAANFTALVIRGEGDSETMQAACRTIGQMLAGFNGAAANGEEALEPAEPVRRITRRPRRQKADRYERPADEPSGFDAPPPKPSRPKFVVERNQKTQPLTTGSGKPPGALALKILAVLDTGSGVAPLEHLVKETGASAQGLNMAITKCRQLKRLDDGRIALAGYRDDD